MRVAGAAFFSLLLASCTTGGLESLEVGNPAYNSSVSTVASNDSADGTAPAAADGTAPASAIVPLTAEQDAQSDTSLAFVPAPKPGDETAGSAGAPGPATEAVAEVRSPKPLVDPASPAAAPAAEAPAVEAQATTVAAAPAPTQFIENRPPEPQSLKTSYAPPPKKRGFLAGLFSASPQEAPVMSTPPREKPAPVVKLASAASAATAVESPARASLGNDLPGVRQSSLFEITRKSGLDDDSDVDLHEEEAAPIRLASAAGMGRLAPNGLITQRESVDVACLKPSLVRMLKQIEGHFRKRAVITSGYRSPTYNKQVRGARNSMHMYCAAVDMQVPGVSKWDLASYVRTMPGRGGVGTYCHTESVHIDVGPERDWNWRCRRRKG